MWGVKRNMMNPRAHLVAATAMDDAPGKWTKRSSSSIVSDDRYMEVGDDDDDADCKSGKSNQKDRQGALFRVGTGRRGQRDGDARSATLNRPFSVCALKNGCGALAFTDMHNNAVRFIVPKEGRDADQKRCFAVRTVENAGLLTPKGMCSSDDGRYLFLCDTGHHKIKFAALPGSSGLISAAESVAGVEIFTFAGNGKKAWRDGPVLDCSFNSPTAVWQCADGTIVVTDTGNHCIRQIVRTGKGNLVVRTIAGGYASYQIPGQERMPENMDANEFQHLNKRNAGFRDGRRALFRSPSGIVEGPYGELLVADTMNNCIRGLLPRSDGKLPWDVQTVCGVVEGGYIDGSCESAAFNQPMGLSMGPNGTFFVSDRGNCCIRQVGGCHAQLSQNKSDCLSYSWVRTIEIGEVPRQFSVRTSGTLGYPLDILYIRLSACLDKNEDELLVVCDGGNNVIEFIPVGDATDDYHEFNSTQQSICEDYRRPSRPERNVPVDRENEGIDSPEN